jgi:hypothetical protein
MSTVADLKKKFEATKKVTLTPEQHAAALRQKERDQQEAVRIAKARAARYNMTLRSLELANAAQNTTAQKVEKAKREETLKSFQQPGRRVSNMKKTTQNKVEVSQAILANALSHERDPKVAVEVVKAVAERVEETLQKDVTTSTDSAKAKQEAEEEALAAAKQEEELRLLAEEEKKKKEADEATAKAAAAAKAAEELREQAAKAEAQASAELKRRAQLEDEIARKAAEEAAAARTAAAEAEAALKAADVQAAEPEVTPEPAVDDGGKFEMTSLTAALDQGSEEAINKAIVTEFLQEHDPSKVADVDKLMSENKGKEGELMMDLVDKYADPVATELKVTAEVIVRVESEAKQDPSPSGENEDIDFIEQQRKEAERIKADEESKIAAMDDSERKLYMEKLAAQAKHSEEKDKMLKSQLNVYGSGGAAALLGGKGRGRGKNRPKSDRQTEYIVSATNEGGQWEVNTE